MPNARIEISDTENAIFRPVVLDVVRQLCEITGIPADTRILFPGDKTETYQQGSTIGEIRSNVERTSLPFNDQIRIEVTEQTHQGNMALSAYRSDMVPIFYDNLLRVALRPVKISTDVELEVKFRSASKSQAIGLKNRLETNLMSYGDINLHEANYHYLIPNWIVDLLATIHKQREAVAGYGDTFDVYLAEHSKTNLTVVANQSGSARSLAYAEKCVRIQGMYDFDIAPQKGTNEDSASTWITTFTYKFQYDKPVACHVSYPVIVHNQLLPKKFVFQDTAPNLDNKRKTFSQAGSVHHYFETQDRLTNYGAYERAITIPNFDEFKPNIVLGDTETIYTALITVDLDNPKVILNLNELGDYMLDPDIYTYLKDVSADLPIPYKTPYLVSLYENGVLTNDRKLYVDDDLNVISRTPLDPRNMYQVRFAVVKDIFSIDLRALKLLALHKDALVKTLLSMKVSLASLKEIYSRVDLITPMRNYLDNTGATIAEIFARTTQMNTVQTQYVVATKRDMVARLKPSPLLERTDANSDL